MRKFAPSFDGRRGLVPPQTSFNVTSGSVHCQTTVTPGSESGHSEGSKNSYMDQCTFGAVRPRGGRGAARKPQSQNSGALSGYSQLDQRKRGPLEIEGVNGLMDSGIECIGVGEGLMGEMMRLEVAPDAFDVV